MACVANMFRFASGPQSPVEKIVPDLPVFAPIKRQIRILPHRTISVRGKTQPHELVALPVGPWFLGYQNHASVCLDRSHKMPECARLIHPALVPLAVASPEAVEAATAKPFTGPVFPQHAAPIYGFDMIQTNLGTGAPVADAPSANPEIKLAVFRTQAGIGSAFALAFKVGWNNGRAVRNGRGRRMGVGCDNRGRSYAN
jgi:hypothetical protein